MLSTFLILVFRLYDWQFNQRREFQRGAEANAIQSVPLPAPRGVIYDRYGTPLALNSPAYVVSVIPANLPDDQNQALDVLNRLSALIDVPATDAAAVASGRIGIRSLDAMVKEGEGIAPYRAVVVKTDVPQRIIQQILEDKQSLPGVDVGQPAAVRQYPNGENGALTAQIVGYLGPIGADEAEALRETGYNPAFERVGYAGVEASLEDALAGTRGLLTQEVDVAGLPVRIINRKEPVAGSNVRLTLDLELQSSAEKALVKQRNHINGQAARPVTESGVVIAMNPQTGEILAMVSWPTYENSRFARNIDADYYLRILGQSFDPLSNHAIGSLYPPGSTWKLITAGAAAQEKIIAPSTHLNDPGELFVENSFAPNDVASRQRFVCWFREGHKLVDLVHGIAWSCDVYFYQIGGGNPAIKDPNVLKPGGLGIVNLDRYATMYGIGTKLGIELPGEVAGRMPDPDWKRRNYGESWSTGDTYNAAFGQGYVTVTPLQLLTATAAIINGGTLYQPTVINSWVDSGGNVLTPFTPKIDRTVALPTNGPAVLNAREDMFIQGKNSLACVCAKDSPFTDPNSSSYDKTLPKCSDEFMKNYSATVRIDRNHPYDDTADPRIPYRPDDTNMTNIQYTVNVPYGYSFRALCDPRQFKPGYQPPFIDPENLGYVQQGMQGAVAITGGTVNLVDIKHTDYHDPVQAGKTGTAEYCDDVANKAGLCHPGSWPEHAWFVGYAPYPKGEIAVVAMVYNGGEGSANALPIVQGTIGCYFRLKDERARSDGKTPIAPCDPKMFWETQ
jgi:penicillin-binding protein 2